MILNTAQSIIDFTKSRGLPSDFESRKKLFIASGLKPEGDEYRGTVNENPALLNYLANQEKTSGVSISPQNVYDVVKAKTQPIATIPNNEVIPQSRSPVGESAFPGAIPVPGTYKSTEGETPAPTTDTTDYSSIFQTPSPEDLASRALQMVQSGATFPLQQEAAQAEKSAANLAGQQEKEKLISTLASRGLFFSGAKETGLSNIDADTLAKTLGVDRKFALLIASGLESAAKSIAKEAQKGNQDALNSLEAMGYTIDPTTGRIAPTLAREKMTAPTNEVLSPTEAATLGVPYGTTQGQAAKLNITPERYKETTAEKVVPFSEWAAKLGIVGQPLEVGTAIAVAQAQDENKNAKERALASVRANIYDYISQWQKSKGKNIQNRETLIADLAKANKDLTVQEIATEVYGLTKVLEPQTKTTTPKQTIAEKFWNWFPVK